ncbi:Aste57867_15268 [Aphanomyces stellatus]|uniref:Aste57867_15268 protein n=1 Tax=Aphanomyces stellatus TaxID=120398 RepID=A0A485L3Q7_9STRA|nr:hypothetical protein As57867_015212 [Aphanomyces stellatus]VFT92077.1 Aste57867_15268 [Aphanomyces stellatus]
MTDSAQPSRSSETKKRPIDTDVEVDPKVPTRYGKWTKEEEAYTARLIHDFSAGILADVENGTTMRSWLSTKLRCCPMRISKKFVGEQSIGKRMFERNETRVLEMTADEKARGAAEMEGLYVDFCESWVREERERLESKTNGTRKRKRSKPSAPSKKDTKKMVAHVKPLPKVQVVTTTLPQRAHETSLALRSHTREGGDVKAASPLKKPTTSMQLPRITAASSLVVPKEPRQLATKVDGGNKESTAADDIAAFAQDMASRDILHFALDDDTWVVPTCDDILDIDAFELFPHPLSDPKMPGLDAMQSPTSVVGLCDVWHTDPPLDSVFGFGL